MSIFCLVNGYLDDVKLSNVLRFEQELHDFMSRDKAGEKLFAEILETKQLPKGDGLKEVVERFKKVFV